MSEENPSGPALAGSFVWERYLGNASLAAGYHDNPRHAVLDLLGREPHCLLEIGCGTGATSALFKQRHPDLVTIGVESNAAAAAVAATRLDRVYPVPFDALDLEAADFPRGRIDSALLLDVLEHMVDPWRALVRLKDVLTSEARVLASLPNVRNLWLMERLAQGHWRYEPEGLLDITHLRFFTLHEMGRLFEETGYRVLQSFRMPDPRLAKVAIPAEGTRVNIEMDRVTLKNVTRQEAMELTATQFILLAEPR